MPSKFWKTWGNFSILVHLDRLRSHHAIWVLKEEKLWSHLKCFHLHFKEIFQGSSTYNIHLFFLTCKRNKCLLRKICSTQKSLTLHTDFFAYKLCVTTVCQTWAPLIEAWQPCWRLLNNSVTSWWSEVTIKIKCVISDRVGKVRAPGRMQQGLPQVSPEGQVMKSK